MEPAGALTAIIDTLRYQRSQGIKEVYLADDTIAGLQAVLGKRSETKPQHEPESAPKPQVSHTQAVTKESETLKPAALIPPVVELPQGDKTTQMAWLRDRVLNCPICQQHLRPGKQLVVGVGDLDAELFFCGEAPGAEEESVGEPFVGPAGQLLTRMIEAMGLKRETVYIGNIMNWRPETKGNVGNRPPTAEELAFCLPYLKAQLAIVRPKVIVALGLTAANGLLGYDPKRRMGAIRGQWQAFEDSNLMVTYHPSYLLRNASKKIKRMVWEDLLKVMETLALSISDKQRAYFSD